MIQFLLEVDLDIGQHNSKYSFLHKPLLTHHIEEENVELFLWGDPILPLGFTSILNKEPTVEKIINNIAGHYYYLLTNKARREIILGNSLFSILPVYYTVIERKLLVAHNAISLAKHIGNLSISKRFILEFILFNYPLFNHSLFESIRALNSNSHISIHNGKWQIFKHTNIANFFPNNPRPWRKSLDDIRDVFLEVVKKYLPETPYIHALTGGFDGRTLVSAGLFHQHKFSCYSLGPRDSIDKLIAAKLCASADLVYVDIPLDEEYTYGKSLNNGLEFIQNASGTATFARAHYLYAAKKLVKNTNVIVTGNFGSEIFRAVHIPGVIFAPNLFNIFDSKEPQTAISKIESSKEFQYLTQDIFKTDWSQLKDDLSMLPCFNPNYDLHTLNQKFYVLVFEEVFRKYFGAEMVNQFYYLRNRTPFLDINFIKEIMNTGLAGIHSDFFEHNPLKRYKGQVLYAHIINKAHPSFGKMILDKGYRPNDLLTLEGKINILKGYIKKRITRHNLLSDPYGVRQSYIANCEYYRNIPIDTELFNYKLLDSNPCENYNEISFKLISLSYLLNQLKT